MQHIFRTITKKNQKKKQHKKVKKCPRNATTAVSLICLLSLLKIATHAMLSIAERTYAKTRISHLSCVVAKANSKNIEEKNFQHLLAYARFYFRFFGRFIVFCLALFSALTQCFRSSNAGAHFYAISSL